MSESVWITKDEIEELKKARPSCGNPQLDFYWLGHDAGKEAGIKEQEAHTRQYQRWYDDEHKKVERLEADNASLKMEVERLKAKVKRLKKEAKHGKAAD